MKITRIQRIRDHRIFRDFTWPNALPDFATFNLIYGWNGTGKTTLSNLFRHLQTKQPIGPTEGEVEFRVDSNAVTGSALATGALPKVRVFNRDAVDRNVFEVPNHQLPPVYLLGEDSVEKERRVVGLKNRLLRVEALKASWAARKANAEGDFERYCTDQARQIKNLLTASGGGPYNNYDSRSFKQTAQRLMAANPPAQRLADDQRTRHLATKEGTPKDKIQPLAVQYPDFVAITNKVQEMLRRSVLSSALPELVANPAVAAWVGQGLVLHTGEHASSKCRFCEQSMPASRMEQLEAHFNDQFRQFQNDLTALIAEAEDARGRISTLRTPSRGLLYPHLAIEYEQTAKILSQQSSLVVMYFDALKRALVAKKDEPFKKLELFDFLAGSGASGDELTVLETVFKVIIGTAALITAKLGQGAYQKINSIIVEHNRHTDAFASRVSAARKALEEDAVIEALASCQSKQRSIADADAKVGWAHAISQAIQTNIRTLELAIQQHQKPAEELNREMASYLGCDELRFEVQETGYTITRSGQPATNLSEGEKTAIAFMYFLKSLEDSGFDTKTGVIVIDDPVSSLDANSLYCAFGFMKARTRDAHQLFVLTHNFTFFRQVRNWFLRRPSQDRKQRPAQFYMLTSKIDAGGKRNAVLDPLDPLLHQFESEYHYLFKRVFDEANRPAGQGPLESFYGLPNIARRLLEAFLAFRVPNIAGELFQKLEHVQFDVHRKTRILRFLHTQSHFDQIGEPEHDLSLLSETPAILKDVLDLIRENDGVHYAGMVEVVDPQPVHAAIP